MNGDEIVMTYQIVPLIYLSMMQLLQNVAKNIFKPFKSRNFSGWIAIAMALLKIS